MEINANTYQVILPPGSTSNDLQQVISLAEETDIITIIITSDIVFVETVFIDKDIDLTIKSEENRYRFLHSSELNERLLSIEVATVKLENILISGNQKKGLLVNRGKLILDKNLTIEDCYDDYLGGGIFADNSEIIINDGATLQRCSSKNEGGGIYLIEGTMTINDGALIKECSSTNQGGGIRTSASTITINGGTFTENKCEMGVGGGGSFGSTLILNGGIFKNNIASNGGGLSAENLIMEGGSIFENSAHFGGGISALGNILVNGGNISNNKTEMFGGGLAIGYGEASINNLIICENESVTGGGIYCTGPVEINKCEISRNKATNGAGIALTFPQLKLSNTKIEHNQASEKGGGIYFQSSNVEEVFLTDNKFIANSACEGGGIYFNPNEGAQLLGENIFCSNIATKNGGAINWSSSIGYYSTLQSSPETKFKCNIAEQGYYPPADVETDYPLLEFASTSLTNHPLNNYDITYTNSGKYDVNFQITYDANGGSGHYIGPLIDPLQSDIILSDEQTQIEYPNYHFISWNDQKDGTGTTYLPSQIVTMQCSFTLYAQWQEPEQLLISYQNNGGSGHYQENASVFSDYIIATLKKTSIRRSGYRFICWNSKMDGTGINYYPDEIVYVENNLILYAIWRKIPTKRKCFKHC